MKHYYRISWNLENTTVHLAISVFLSVFVMFFINICIGSMGGIPALIAFLLIFYMQRGMVIAGNRISHQLAMDSKKELRYMMASYAIGYIVLWAIIKFLGFLSHIAGWGNIDGLTIGEYLERIYGTTMLEMWAYFFAGILMFAFVMSLFPLIVIRKPKAWISYLIADSIIFAGLCALIAGVCRFFIDDELVNRAMCVLDDMLLCELTHPWQGGLYIIGVIALTFAVMVVTYKIAAKTFLPKPGSTVVDETQFRVCTEEERLAMQKERKRKILLWGGIGCFCIAVCVVTIGYILFGEREERPHYNQVAECLTEDPVLGPMLYGSVVYLPVEMELNYYETGQPLGYLGYKEEDCTSRFYELAIANVLYKSPDWEESYLQMYGKDEIAFEEAEKIEEDEVWRVDSVFLLWDEAWESQSNYTKDITGYSVCEKDFILQLEKEFGVVKYNPNDFKDYHAYFTIRAYHDMKEAFRAGGNSGDWVGCILVKEDKFYYGNYQNEITGNLLEKLLEILGGHKNEK